MVHNNIALKKGIIIAILVTITFACKNKKNTKKLSEATIVKDSLKTALTFYSSFDNGVDADFSLGDAHMYTVPNRKAIDSAKVGLHKPDISIQQERGKYGSGIVFTERSSGNIYYPSKDNIAYKVKNWSGAISFWLNLDPEKDLKPGYCDPIQITDVSYNDAAIWVDFTKENPRDFRLGVIGDRNIWNPNPEGPDNENPIFNERLVGVKNPPFGSNQWTHILINFSNLNTANGKATFYLNGKQMGVRKNIDTPFTWELSKSNIYLGLGYIGVMDDLSIYNRNLSDTEITVLYSLENGVQSILTTQ